MWQGESITKSSLVMDARDFLREMQRNKINLIAYQLVSSINNDSSFFLLCLKKRQLLLYIFLKVVAVMLIGETEPVVSIVDSKNVLTLGCHLEEKPMDFNKMAILNFQPIPMNFIVKISKTSENILFILIC